MEKFEFTPKTCDEYVVAELIKTKENCARMLDDNIRLATEIAENLHSLAVLNKYLKLRHGTDGDWYITADLIFENYNKEDFDRICKLLDLEKPEPENTEEVE